jgi:hypothetical protein
MAFLKKKRIPKRKTYRFPMKLKPFKLTLKTIEESDSENDLDDVDTEWEFVDKSSNSTETEWEFV